MANKNYYTPEQELAMESKRQEMVELINSCDDREEQEILWKRGTELVSCDHCLNLVKNKIEWIEK